MTIGRAPGVFYRLTQAAAAATVSFSLLTLFDEQHRVLELFSHFRVQYFVAAATIAVVFAALRKPAGFLTMLATAAVNGALVVPWYTDDVHDTGSATLKILHANVQASNEDAASVLDVIGSERPDVIFLQEINDRWLEDLEPLAKTYPFRLAVPRDDNFGIAAYAKIPPLASRAIASPPSGFPTLLLRLSVAGRPMTLVSSHPAPPIGSAGHHSRNVQLGSIGALLAAIAEPKVLIGDLNVTMWSHNYATLTRVASLVDARRGRGVLPTWPVGLPIAMIPIDHCLTSSDIAVVDLLTGPDIGSDHRPLIAGIAFRK